MIWATKPGKESEGFAEEALVNVVPVFASPASVEEGLALTK